MKQSKPRKLTRAELEARVHRLDGELAGARQTIEVLVGAMVPKGGAVVQPPAPPVSAPWPPNVPQIIPVPQPPFVPGDPIPSWPPYGFPGGTMVTCDAPAVAPLRLDAGCAPLTLGECWVGMTRPDPEVLAAALASKGPFSTTSTATH